MGFRNILLIGCGNMAGAMLQGWQASLVDAGQTGSGPVQAGRFSVFDPAQPALPDGVARVESLVGSGPFDALLLGVKPQILAAVAAEAEPLAGPQTTVLSLLAGVELATLARYFPRAMGLVRVMPNLAVAVGKAPIALAGAAGASGPETALGVTLGVPEPLRAAVLELMLPLGTPEWIAEADFDLVTALAGSGPAFVYRFIAALGKSAAELGLDPAQAMRLAIAMVEGAGALAAASPHDPDDLADRVASPGGVTREGLNVLDGEAALHNLVRTTLLAARDRSSAMAAEARRQGGGSVGG